jgi:hypothetical protein
MAKKARRIIESQHRVSCRVVESMTHAGRERAPSETIALRPDQAARLSAQGILEILTTEEKQHG